MNLRVWTIKFENPELTALLTGDHIKVAISLQIRTLSCEQTDDDPKNQAVRMPRKGEKKMTGIKSKMRLRGADSGRSFRRYGNAID